VGLSAPKKALSLPKLNREAPQNSGFFVKFCDVMPPLHKPEVPLIEDSLAMVLLVTNKGKE